MVTRTEGRCFLYTVVQETYLDEGLNECIKKKKWGGQILSTFETLHGRGVTILFEKGLDIEIENHHKTIDGRKILVNVKMGNKYALVNIYAPTVASRREIFYKKT